MSAHTTEGQYRADIDGLRAIAILSVVIFHAFPGRFPGGFVGVDIFFVLSGFLISTNIFNHLQGNNFSLLDFYSRRVKRIFPALLAVFLFIILFGWFFLLPDEYQAIGKHILGGATFTSNFVLWSESGYFDVIAETKPLLHLWSLGIEEQFYIFFPLMLILVRRLKLNLIFFISGMGIISFLIGLRYTYTDPVAAYYAPYGRFWEIMIGAVTAWVFSYHPPVLSRIFEKKFFLNTITLIGALFLWIGFTFISKKSDFPGLWALLPTVGAALIISAQNKTWLGKSILSHKLMVGIGLISYPLYLWHWIFLSLARIMQTNELSEEIRGYLILLSFIFAYLTYKFIEKPIRSRHSKRSVLALVTGMLVLALSGLCIYLSKGYVDRKVRFGGEHPFTQKVYGQFEGPRWKYEHNDICTAKYPLVDKERVPWWFCMTNNDRAPQILILGNSYANHYYPGFAQNPLFQDKNILSIGNCDPRWFDENDVSKQDPVYACKIQHDLINEIIKNNHLEYAILAGFLEKFDDNNIERIIKRIIFIESYGAKVIVFYPHFRPPYDIKGCFGASPPFDCKVSASAYEDFISPFKKLVSEVEKRKLNVKFFDPNTAYCNKKECSFIVNDLPLFRDQYNHFSVAGSTEIINHFSKWFLENGVK